jgi:hypothetical protein
VDSSQLGAASREAAALRAELARIGSTNVNARVSQSFTQVTRSAGAANRSVNQTGDSINQLTGRLSLLADGLLVLGPGLVPIAAVGVQALGGLTAAAAALGVAGASAVVAFQGLGDAVTAVQEYQMDPTVDGLEKAKEAMDALPVDAQRFVTEFQKFRPVLSEIRGAAAAGWFPGLTESLDKFAELGPRIEDIFFRAGEAGGFLVDQAAGSLASERWSPFMDFLEREVPTVMGSLARTVGDLTHGLTEMLMAFDPGNDSFLAWLEDVADGFDRWASSAEAQESIQGLLTYARENGPEVAALFESLVGALTAIVQAAAPLGGPVLTGLTAVADMVKVIAESDMATPLLAAIAALRIFNRFQAAAIAGRSRFNQMTAVPAAPVAPRPTAAAASAAAGLPPHLQAALAAPRASDVRAQQAAIAAQRQRAMVGGVGVAAGIGLLASGAASELELTNTAMLGLAGTMAGPFGAAAGIMAGAAMDAAAANNDLAASIEAAGAAIDSGDFIAGTEALAAAQREQAKFVADYEKVQRGDIWTQISNPGASLGAFKSDIEGIFGDSDIEEGEKALARLEDRLRSSQLAVADLGEAMGVQVGEVDGSTRSIEELNRVLESAKPAMDALGVTAQDLADGAIYDQLAQGDGLFGAIGRQAVEAGRGAQGLAGEIAAQASYMDSAAGKTENYRRALAELVRETGTAEERATGLGEALDRLLNPSLDAEAALDRVRALMKEIRELNPEGGFRSNNEVGQQNRQATRDFVAAVQERLTTMVAAKRSEEDIARTLEKSREQFIQSGIAAGFSAQQMRRRANAIGLTPKLIETTFRALGITKADRELAALQGKFNDLPRSVRTLLRTEGVPKSRAEAEALAEKYKLTERQRETLFTIVDRASGPARALAATLDNAARNRSATITITTHRRNTQSNNVLTDADPPGSADGGYVPKDGGPYMDRFNYLLAPGEFVVSNRYGQADRNRALLEAVNAGRTLAEGGVVAAERNHARYAARSGGSARPSVRVDVGGLEVTGVLDTPWGPARIRGEMREVARQEIDAEREFERSHGL